MKAFQASIAVIALALPACGGTETEQLPDENAPVFAPDQGQDPAPQPADTLTYPGPYGLTIGSIVPNFALYGYPNFSAGPKTSEVQLSHFFNPTGTETFPEGSQYGGGALKPKAIVLMMSASWCGPCQYEASVLLPSHVPQYPEAIFVATLIDGPVVGTPAKLVDLQNWANNYDVFYPLVNDPAESIMALYEPAFPGNMIIRTKDMKIMFRMAGAADPQYPEGAAFWTTLEQVIAGTYEP
jgi:hypothetical protein